MKKIIKNGRTEFRTVCQICGCEFTYDECDVVRNMDGEYFVLCPECNRGVNHELPKIDCGCACNCNNTNAYVHPSGPWDKDYKYDDTPEWYWAKENFPDLEKVIKSYPSVYHFMKATVCSAQYYDPEHKDDEKYWECEGKYHYGADDNCNGCPYSGLRQKAAYDLDKDFLEKNLNKKGK